MAQTRTNQNEQVLARFTRRPLGTDTLNDIARTTEEFHAFAESLLTRVPEGRERSLALTSLQEAKFWANEAIAAASALSSAKEEGK